MPKFNSLAAHASKYVDMFGSPGAIAEQSFEHYQGNILKHRDTYSPNKWLGGQIGEHLIHSWLESCPYVHAALKMAEETLINSKDGARIKRRKFSL